MRGHDPVHCVELLGGNEARTQTFLAGGLEILLVSRPVGGKGGGDVYCIHSCGHGSLAKFVLLDLAGHGAERNAFARSVHTLLHRYGNETRPGPLLQQINRHYHGFVLPPVYATGVSAIYVPNHGDFRFSNAGQPRPFRWSAAEGLWSISLLEKESDCGMALGILPDGCYEEETIPLAVGDQLLFASDGLPETRNSSDEFLDPKGILPRLSDAMAAVGPHAPLAQLADDFLRRVVEFHGRQEFEDDLTMLWVRRLKDETAAPTERNLT